MPKKMIAARQLPPTKNEPSNTMGLGEERSIREKEAEEAEALAIAKRRRSLTVTYTKSLGTEPDHAELDEFMANFYADFYKEDRKRVRNELLQKHPEIASQLLLLVPRKVTEEEFWERYEYRCDPHRIAKELRKNPNRRLKKQRSDNNNDFWSRLSAKNLFDNADNRNKDNSNDRRRASVCNNNNTSEERWSLRGFSASMKNLLDLAPKADDDHDDASTIKTMVSTERSDDSTTITPVVVVGSMDKPLREDDNKSADDSSLLSVAKTPVATTTAATAVSEKQSTMETKNEKANDDEKKHESKKLPDAKKKDDYRKSTTDRTSERRSMKKEETSEATMEGKRITDASAKKKDVDRKPTTKTKRKSLYDSWSVKDNSSSVKTKRKSLYDSWSVKNNNKDGGNNKPKKIEKKEESKTSTTAPQQRADASKSKVDLGEKEENNVVAEETNEEDIMEPSVNAAESEDISVVTFDSTPAKDPIPETVPTKQKTEVTDGAWFKFLVPRDSKKNIRVTNNSNNKNKNNNAQQSDGNNTKPISTTSSSSNIDTLLKKIDAISELKPTTTETTSDKKLEKIDTIGEPKTTTTTEKKSDAITEDCNKSVRSVADEDWAKFLIPRESLKNMAVSTTTKPSHDNEASQEKDATAAEEQPEKQQQQQPQAETIVAAAASTTTTGWWRRAVKAMMMIAVGITTLVLMKQDNTFIHALKQHKYVETACSSLPLESIEQYSLLSGAVSKTRTLLCDDSIDRSGKKNSKQRKKAARGGLFSKKAKRSAGVV